VTIKSIAAIGAVGVTLAVLVFIRANSAGRTLPPPATQRLELPATGVAYRGLAIQVNTGYRPLERYVPMLREIAELGANCVLLSTAGYMENAEAQGIFIDARRTPAAPEFIEIIRTARSLGLKVVVMPILLLSHPRGSEWRGVIEPPDWDEWWQDYREFLLHFADIARAGQAEALLVGSELVSTERDTRNWVLTIETVRERFPEGLMGYSANWDHYEPVQFWDHLDFVGMTSYYTLADKDDPTVAEIIERWRPIHEKVMAWQQRIGRPILMTEVGWCSQTGAAAEPWNYFHNMRATPEGLEEQRRLYEAFMRVWAGSPGLMGVIWWEWTAGPGGPDDFGYTPKGKPAERMLREWFAAEKPTTQPAAADALPTRRGQADAMRRGVP